MHPFNFKHWRYLLLLSSMALITGLCGCGDGGSSSHSETTVKELPPLSYYKLAPDLIDISRYEVDTPLTEKADYLAATQKVINQLGETLSGQTDITVLSNDYSDYDNWTWKIAQGVGTRLLALRLKGGFEQRLLSSHPRAYQALPFRFVVMVDEYDSRQVLHLALVDPLRYLQQFDTSLNDTTRTLLNDAKNRLLQLAQQAFPHKPYDPQQAATPLPNPKGLTALMDITDYVPADMTAPSVTDKLINGRLYADGSPVPDAQKGAAVVKALEGTLDVDGDGSADGPYTKEQLALHGFLPFKTHFGPYKKTAANLSEAMEFIVGNSILLPFGESHRVLTYELPGGNLVDQILVYDAYIPPMLMTAGTDRFSSLPLSVFVERTPDDEVVSLKIQDPLFNTLRYFGDITSNDLDSLRQRWNSLNDDPATANKVHWPDWTLEQMGRNSRNSVLYTIDRALKYYAKPL